MTGHLGSECAMGQSVCLVPCWSGKIVRASAGITSPQASLNRMALAPCFNGKLSDELLNEEVFVSLGHAKRALSLWRHDFNNVRPHSGIGGLAPATRPWLSQCGSIAPGALPKQKTWRYQQTGLS
ncbi:integrase core domain-containing protein [Candidatus Phycosocius spiralis]|uniref:integrase core domain-containing protein n=1 Tax=Candidatus Phycosocius spiralis TaxID=2815099 RepID=UPI003B9685E5